MNVIEQAPIGTKRMAAVTALGASEAAMASAEKAAADPTSSGRLGAARDAAPRAPTSEPPATTANRAPYSPAPPPKTYLAKSGSTMMKLNPKVAITVTSSSVDRSTGVCHTYRRPSRTWPLALGARS